MLRSTLRFSVTVNRFAVAVMSQDKVQFYMVMCLSPIT